MGRTIRMLFWWRKSTILSLTFGLITLIYLLANLSVKPKYIYGQNDPSSLYNPEMFRPGTSRPLGQQNYTRVLVMGHLRNEDVSWVSRDVPGLRTKFYVVDDDASSGLPANKGHEAMVYLTYIIDHYDFLPDVVLFFHPHKIAWHNNILLDIDTSKTLKLLSSPHVVRQGYFNTRCHLDPGCPNWLHVDRPRWRHDLKHKPEEPALTGKLFHELHGVDAPIPHAISQPCCAQFAVSGERIRQRPRADYVRYRDWLLSTDLDDKTSGRLMEYSWQYIFTGNFEFCPSQHKCYCDGYGICFEGEAGLQNWLAVLKQREKVEEKLSALWDSGVKGGEKYKRLAARVKQKTESLDRLREDALRRGFDPALRAAECGREWHEGDGF